MAKPLKAKIDCGAARLITNLAPGAANGEPLTFEQLGGNPWTKVVLGSDFVTSNATNTNVTGLSFTPAANKRYLIQAFLLVRTATATVGPRPGILWPTAGITAHASKIEVPNSNTAAATRFQGDGTTQNAAGTGLPTTADEYLALIEAILIMGASPAGPFQITNASETAGTNVTVVAGSLLMYQEY